MNTAREYMDELRRRAARLEQLAREMAEAARQGRALDEAGWSELNSAQAKLRELRDELNAVMPRVNAKWENAREMSMEQLDECVDEWELRARMGEGAVRRMRDALAQMEKLNMPARVIAPMDELVRRAEAALGAHELAELGELERQTEPYCELCRLLKAGMEVEQSACELLGRIGDSCPQVEWYVRARLLHGEPEQVVDLTALQAKPEPAAKPRRRARRAKASPDAASQPAAPTPDSTRAQRTSVHDEMAQRMVDVAQVKSIDAWHALVDDYPEVRALSGLVPGVECESDRYEQLVWDALGQARALDEVIEDALHCIDNMAQMDPKDSELARAWTELADPDRGEVRRALDIVANRRKDEYVAVLGLCGRLLSKSLPNGLNLNALSELARGLKAEQLMELVRMTAPCMVVLGRWNALLKGDITLRMRMEWPEEHRRNPSQIVPDAIELREPCAGAGERATPGQTE